jgi:hypothetical protein
MLTDPTAPEARPLSHRRFTTAIQDACDARAGTLYYPILCIALLLMTAFTGWYAEKLAGDWEQWVIADWLISYAPGFVRRGLSGELLLRVSSAIGIPANRIVYWLIVALFASFALVFAWLLRNRRMTFWYFVLCLSPGSVLFTFYSESAVGRKESLIFVAFAAWALVSTRRGPVSRAWHLAFAALAFVLTLMHEMFFFFSLYFPLLSWIASRPRDEARRWRMSLWIPALSSAALLAIVLFGGSLNDPALCDRLVRSGAPASVCTGVLEYQEPPAFTRLTSELNLQMARAIVTVAPIVFVPAFLFLTASTGEPARRRWTVAGIMLGVFAFSAPLFVLAVDWGRWLAIHTVLLTVLCAVLLERKGHAQPRRDFDERASLLPFTCGLLIVASLFTWSIKYCCGSDVLTVWGPVTSITGMWEEIESNLAD